MKDITISQLASRYQLKVDGIPGRVFTPYWINWDQPPYRLDAPLRGKGTPEELSAKITAHLGTISHYGWSPSAVRHTMRQLGLGVDCSGFAYYVLDQYLRGHDLGGLAHQLLIYRSEIEAAMERHPDRAFFDGDISSLPEWLPLSAVCELWNKQPVMITSVRRLTDPRVCRSIPTVDQMRAGDLIKMTNRNGDHVAVVSAVSPAFIDYVASEDEVGGIGGIQTHRIKLQRPKSALELQDWDQSRLYAPGETGDGVWRLGILDRI